MRDAVATARRTGAGTKASGGLVGDALGRRACWRGRRAEVKLRRDVDMS